VTLRLFEQGSLGLLPGCLDSFCLYSDLLKNTEFMFLLLLNLLHLQFIDQLCDSVSYVENTSISNRFYTLLISGQLQDFLITLPTQVCYSQEK